MRALIYISLILVIASCNKANDRKCLKKKGYDILEIRYPSSFNTVVLNDHIDLSIVEDSSQFIEVSSGENLINFISTSVKGEVLEIFDGNKCGFLRNLDYKTKVIIHTPDINRIELYGSGSLEINHNNISSLVIEGDEANGDSYLNVQCDSLNIGYLGSPRFTLNGTSNFSYFYLFGNGSFNAENLVSNDCIINWNSTGDLSLNVTSNLNGQIFASGNVYYTGNPAVNVSSEGSGRLIKLD